MTINKAFLTSRTFLIALAALIVILVVILQSPETRNTITGGASTGDNVPSEASPGRVVQTAEIPFLAFPVGMTFLLPEGWEMDVPLRGILELYDPARGGETPRDKSTIFITTYRADEFRPEDGYAILIRSARSIENAEAVRFILARDVSSEASVLEPEWRGEVHEETHIRPDANRQVIIIVAQNPALDDSLYEEFIASIQFEEVR